jgi:hypothetical protein
MEVWDKVEKSLSTKTLVTGKLKKLGGARSKRSILLKLDPNVAPLLHAKR